MRVLRKHTAKSHKPSKVGDVCTSYDWTVWHLEDDHINSETLILVFLLLVLLVKCKLYSRVFGTFLPNVIKIYPYNFELYHFKVGTFFWDTVLNCSNLKFLPCLVSVSVVKKQKAKTKSSKSQSAIKETHNGLPSRLTSNGIEDDNVADNRKLSTAAGRAKRKSKSSKHNKTSQSAVDSQSNMEVAGEREVRVGVIFVNIFGIEYNHLRISVFIWAQKNRVCGSVC